VTSAPPPGTLGWNKQIGGMVVNADLSRQMVIGSRSGGLSDSGRKRVNALAPTFSHTWVRLS
jgi:hypothetical protein